MSYATHLGKHTTLWLLLSSLCLSLLQVKTVFCFDGLHLPSFLILLTVRLTGLDSNHRSISLHQHCLCSHKRDATTKGPPKIPANPPHAEQAGLTVWITSGGWHCPAPLLQTEGLVYNQYFDCISYNDVRLLFCKQLHATLYVSAASRLIQGVPPNTHHFLNNMYILKLPRPICSVLMSHLTEI